MTDNGSAEMGCCEQHMSGTELPSHVAISARSIPRNESKLDNTMDRHMPLHAMMRMVMMPPPQPQLAPIQVSPLAGHQPLQQATLPSSLPYTPSSLEPRPLGPQEMTWLVGQVSLLDSGLLSSARSAESILDGLRPLLVHQQSRGGTAGIQASIDMMDIESPHSHHHANIDRDHPMVRGVSALRNTSLQDAMSPNVPAVESFSRSSGIDYRGQGDGLPTSSYHESVSSTDMQEDDAVLISIASFAKRLGSPSPSGKTPESTLRFRASHFEQWDARFQDLIEFRQEEGHCLVPFEYAQNQKLSHWVKRQRGQMKLKQAGKRSTLTEERQAALDELGFVWDSHKAAWEMKYNELSAFKDRTGHCHVPPSFSENPQLAMWLKTQRRLLKRYYAAGAKAGGVVEQHDDLTGEDDAVVPRYAIDDVEDDYPQEPSLSGTSSSIGHKRMRPSSPGAAVSMLSADRVAKLIELGVTWEKPIPQSDRRTRKRSR